jgi:hypothetical protein
MATKKMAVKKMVAKKPAAAMKKASPMKQKPRVDDADMKAYIKSQGAAKDKQVATHKQGLQDRDKGGYTNDQINLYKNIAGLGEWAMGGAKVNYRTGESEITKFDKKYRHGSNDNMRDAAFTKGGKGEGTKAGSRGGNSSGFPSQEYLKQSEASKMSDRQFRTQFVNDSIRTQGRKEEHKNLGENYGRVAKLYGMQTSQVGANVKAAIKKTPTTKAVVKKTPTTKAVVKKKTPLTQTKPTVKKPSNNKDPRKEYVNDGPGKPGINTKTGQINRKMAKGPSASKNSKQDVITVGGRSLEKNGIRGDLPKSSGKRPEKKGVGLDYGDARGRFVKDQLSSTKRTPGRTPVKQFIDPEAKKREQERRNKMTVDERKREGTSMTKGPRRDSMRTNKKTTVGVAGKLTRSYPSPAKMKKC